MPSNTSQITPPRVPIMDERTNSVSREWYRWFYNIYTITGGGLGITPVINGGTGLGTIPTNGQLLIGNGTGYTLNTLGAGAGISVTNGLGTIVVANTGVLSTLAGAGISVSSAIGDVTITNTGVLSTIAGAGISVSSATGDVTINNTGVLSWSGGTTGLTPAAATTGAVTLGGTLAIANGGTNAAATPTAGGVAYGTGTAYAITAAGTTGQILISNAASAPTWSSAFNATAVSTASVASPLAWDSSAYAQYALTALANALTINADANAAPVDGQRMTFRIKDNGTARALTWTTGSAKSFRVIGTTLPTTTVVNKIVYVGCIYNSADFRWDVIAVAQEV